jgi:hypothetical protein
MVRVKLNKNDVQNDQKNGTYKWLKTEAKKSSKFITFWGVKIDAKNR